MMRQGIYCILLIFWCTLSWPQGVMGASPKKNTEAVTDVQLLTYKKIIHTLEILRQGLQQDYKQALLTEKSSISYRRFWEFKKSKSKNYKGKKVNLSKKEGVAF